MSTVTTRLGLTKPIDVEQFSLATYNNNLDTIDGYAVNTLEKMPKGLLMRDEAVAPAGPTASGIIKSIPTFTFKQGRRYRIGWEFSWHSSVSGTYAYFSINTCPVADPPLQLTGMTQINGRTYVNINANLTQSAGSYAYIEPSFDTTVQVKFHAIQVVGTGMITIVGNTGEDHTYFIEDCGAQY